MCMQYASYATNEVSFNLKEWYFVVEDEDPKGRRKVLCSAPINMADFASAVPAQFDLKIKLKSASKKVVASYIQLTLSTVFIR